MNPLNIVIAVSQFPTPESPNIGVYVTEQARALHNLGHKVVIVHAFQKSDRSSPGIEITENWWQGLRVIHVEYPLIRFTWYLPCVIALMLGIRRAKKYIKPDIAHAHFTLPVGLASLIAGRLLSLPVVITEHTGPIREICRDRLTSWAMRFSLSNVDSVVAVSNFLKNEMVKDLGVARSINVIPNLIDLAKFSLNDRHRADNSDKPLNVLFVSRSKDQRKGNDLVIKAFAKALLKNGRRIKLVIAGESLEGELGPLVDDLKIRDHCVFTGVLTLEQLSRLMSQCGFLVVASRYETFSLVTIEAMACGKPVVATRCGGPEELIKPETGLLVPVDDADALAGAIVDMSDNLERYEAELIARYARECFSEEVVARRLTQVYEQVLN